MRNLLTQSVIFVGYIDQIYRAELQVVKHRMRVGVFKQSRLL